MSKWFKKEVKKITDPVASEPAEKTRVSKSITESTICLKSRFGNSFDILYKEISLKGNKALFVMDDGMCNNMQVIWQVIGPVLFAPNMPNEPSRQADYIRDRITTGADQSQTYDLDEAITDVLSGLIVLFIDGVDFCLEFGVQGFPKRSVDDAKTEVQERGSHEGFTESFKDNAALLRRRVRSPIMKCETLTVGTTSKTRICVCYMSDRASQETVDNIKARLKKAKLDMVLGSGYIAPFLDTQSTSFFSGVGTTERPDVACAEMAEGRVVLLVDGTPFALIVPYLFVENFQSMDDYNYRPYYAVFIRTLKFISFLISVFFPGIYVAVCTFHQEVLPSSMLYDMAVQESMTPFPVMVEAIFIHFLYEVMREAGLRMPKAVGHAVSIVGALVIGDAAVTAGLIAAPMLIVVAMTAISSFVVSQLYQPVSVLRFLFMIIGGITGFYGIVLGFGVLLVNICAINPYKVPYTSSISPFTPGSVRDTILRFGWRRLGRRELNIDKMKR